MSDYQDPDSEYYGMKLRRNTEGRVMLAFGSVLAKRGDQVRYLDENGHDYQKEAARKFFKKGDVATIERISVGRCSSKYYLVGILGEWNTVMFETVIPGDAT